MCVRYCHTLQSVNPHLLFVTVVDSFAPILHCSICNVSYYYSPLVSSFSRPLCFPFSPRTMTLASSAFHWPKSWDSLVFVQSAFRFHTPKYIIAFLASRARLRVGDVIKVRCHRNHPEAFFLPRSHQHPMNVNEPLITPVIAFAWYPPVVRLPGSSLTLLARRNSTYLDSSSANYNLFRLGPVLLLLHTKMEFLICGPCGPCPVGDSLFAAVGRSLCLPAPFGKL